MAIHHYKRLRMELDLLRARLAEPVLPEGYVWAAWHPVLMETHARVKFESFRGELDAEVFELLSTLSGCRRLVTDIAHSRGFAPVATWLIRFEGDGHRGPAHCATIQGVKSSQWVGNIQNVGVLADHRNLGLGRALILKSVAGFRSLGVRSVWLEVTAANRNAVGLYESMGFVARKTAYRSVEALPQHETA